MKKEAPFSIEIPKLCGENRDLMDKTEKGWFCNVCNKEVIDFREKSDAAFREAFKNPSHQPCGVFRPDQVVRPLSARRNCSSYSNTWKALTLVFAGALAGEGCFMGKRADPEDAQRQDQPKTEVGMRADTTHSANTNQSGITPADH